MINKVYLMRFFALLFFSLGLSAQVSVTPQNVEYTNNGQPKSFVTGCGNIDLASSTSTLISMIVNIDTYTSVINNSESKLYIYTKKSYSDVKIQRYSKTIPSTNWTPGSAATTLSYSPPVSFYINASDFNATGGTLLVTFVSPSGTEYTSSCTFTITKTPPPSFSISPESVSLGCGEVTGRIITITPANIPAGVTPSYSWSFPGWTEVGSTANSKTLQPNSGSLLPSAITVTQYVNGVATEIKTSTISRSAFTSTASISGSASICTPATSSSYSITNLGAENSVTWSSSDTSVATVSSTTGNDIIVNKVSDGIFYLIARITNSCGQFVDVPKTVKFGGAPVFAVLSGWIPQQPYISRISMVSIDPNIPLSAEGITATTWIEKLANGSTRDCKTGTGLFTATVLYDSQYVTVTATNSCGTSTQVIDIIDLFGLGLEFRQNNTESTKEIIKTFPNPATDIINIEIENTELSTKSNNIEAQLYDMMGQFREKVEFTNNKATFSVRDYPKGLYFLKVNIDGKIETKQIIVE